MRRGTLYLMLAPNLILFLALTVYPIGWALRYMFYRYDGTYRETFIGLGNFNRLLTRDTIYWASLGHTFEYAGGKLLLILPLAFLVAMLLNLPFRGRTAMQAVVFSPTIMSSAVMGLMFYLLFNVYNGDVNRYLMKLHLIHAPINWLGPKLAMLTVVLVAVWEGMGNYMVYFLAGLQTIPKEVYESAAIDGAGYWRRLFAITIPMMGPVVRVVLMLAILASFQDIQSIMVMTGGGPLQKTQVVFLYIYQLFFPIDASTPVQPQIGYGAAASVLTGLILGGITLIYLYISKKLDDLY